MMNSIAIVNGGGVRIGLEDNIWYDTDRTKLTSNQDLTKRIHVLAHANRREVMAPAELRKLLNLNSCNGEYGRAK
jgi:3-keto-5-aminohexanoate cleavage enzyme